MIDELTAQDVPHNVALSRSVGWHDTESEWRVLHEAALVLGVRQQGRLVAQGALAHYGSVASLAKMVVAPKLQGRGLGARLLDRLLDVADQRGISVGLCATEQGRPLYASRGFSVNGQIAILTGTASLGTSEVGPAVPLVDAARALALDRLFTGCDRSRALRARLREASAAFLLDSPGEGGFAMLTKQSPMSLVGPIMAESERGARALLAALLRAAPGSFRIDVPLQHAGLRSWLVECGLVERARRVEMGRGTARLPWQVEQRFALATQAWG